MIREVLYIVQDATWLLDSGATFHVTPNIECFSNYSVDTSGTVRTRKWARVHNRRDRRGSHLTTEWQHDHPAPCSART